MPTRFTQLFQPPAGSSATRASSKAYFPGFFGRGGGGPAPPSQPQSDARLAASHVVAVADQPSNSVVVSAPDEYMATISEIVSRLDTSISDITETRIFRLLHADATEMSNILNTLYSSTSTSGGQPGRGSSGAAGARPAAAGGGSAARQPSLSAILEAQMVAVADPRTNSVVVSASRDNMEEIALTVGRLDTTDDKKQHVHIYTLENADPDNVASILQGMFTANANNTLQNNADVLSQRTSTGASSSDSQ